ncbi:MAG: MFS transporter [Deltaproteobacteria bacterium]|nr:MFS transporter [Deltaproteobacteria bacterium]
MYHWLRRLPIFYGWFIVAVSMLSAFLGAGLNNISMGVVLKPLSQDLGWTRTVTSGAITAGAILGGALAPLFGRLADRLGPRALLPAGAATVGLLALAVSQITEPWQFYVAYVPARALVETVTSGVVPVTAVANWFYLKRPRAIGMVLMAIPMGSAALSLLYQSLILHSGWRSTFLVLGLLLWLFVVIPGALLLRRQPEDMGLVPDGSEPLRGGGSSTADAMKQEPDSEYSWRLREAVRTSTLWFIIASFTLWVIALGGIAFHLVAYLTDKGIGPVVAAGALSLFALAGALGNFAWGWLAERIDVRRLSGVTLLVSALAVLLLMEARAPLRAYGVAALLGLTARGGSVFSQVILARYFGRRSFGAISGVAEPFIKAGLGLGPLLAALAFDLTGSYRGIFAVFSGMFVVAAFLVLLARRPEITPGP